MYSITSLGILLRHDLASVVPHHVKELGFLTCHPKVEAIKYELKDSIGRPFMEDGEL